MILEYYWHIYPQTIVGFLGLGLLIALLNFFSIRRLDEFPTAQHLPRVSILVPARNEETNIAACVMSLLAQNYPDFEVLVLDDDSTDQTRVILEGLAQHDPRLKVYTGEPLPIGWLGKHWACHQLSQKATGDLLLFTDADTRHGLYTLRDSVSALLASSTDLITAFPHEEMRTWGECLTVPILGFGIFCFFPVWLAEKFRLPVLSITIGQFMLFRRAAFESIGGYTAVYDQPADDIGLGRLIITNGFRWKLMDATRHVTCRMYSTFSDALNGFTKNIFAVFSNHILLYCIGWFWIAVSFLVPLYMLFTGLVTSTKIPIGTVVIAILEALLMMTLAYHRLRLPMYLVLLYPLSILIFTWIALRSLAYTVLGYRSWKGRTIAPPVLKL